MFSAWKAIPAVQTLGLIPTAVGDLGFPWGQSSNGVFLVKRLVASGNLRPQKRPLA
jgi:hypothetical protein